jgi:hypothetical protein
MNVHICVLFGARWISFNVYCKHGGKCWTHKTVNIAVVLCVTILYWQMVTNGFEGPLSPSSRLNCKLRWNIRNQPSACRVSLCGSTVNSQQSAVSPPSDAPFYKTRHSASLFTAVQCANVNRISVCRSSNHVLRCCASLNTHIFLRDRSLCLTALTDWCMWQRRNVFTERYGLNM